MADISDDIVLRGADVPPPRAIDSQILDYVREHPDCTTAMIRHALGLASGSRQLGRRLSTLFYKGELLRSANAMRVAAGQATWRIRER